MSAPEVQATLHPTLWFEETHHHQFNNRIPATAILYHARSEHQELLVFESELFGRVLAIDGAIQTTERDEAHYHEMLVHVPLFAHGSARRVLVIGGGDGGALREVLRHPVERVTLVELDRTVIDLAREHLPMIAGGAFEDPRLDLVIADGTRFVAESSARFDAIVIDSTDPVGPAQALFDEPFYRHCGQRLEPGGILACQAGVPFLQAEQLRRSSTARRAAFADASAYVGAVPTYNGGLMAFGWGSDRREQRRHDLETLTRRYQSAGIDTRYYNPEIHLGCFALPSFIRELVEGSRPPKAARR